MVRADLPAETAQAAGRALGLSDDAFEQRRPVRGQITKSEVRAVTLYALQLRPDSLVWDIGAGTGSVAVEAARIAHLGSVYAVDKDANNADLLRNNVARYGEGRVSVVIGTAPDALRDLPDPDAVFIGGGSAAMPDILDTVISRLQPAGRVVANFAVMERAGETYRTMCDAGMSPGMTLVSVARGRELPDRALRLEAMNPVFIVWGQKE
jgi:precorrin-6Y C5,15-methyltransferase (decarboxylating)